MKTTIKTILFASAIGLAAACSPRNENSAQDDMQNENESVEEVAPADETTVPSDSTTQTYDSAAQR